MKLPQSIQKFVFVTVISFYAFGFTAIQSAFAAIPAGAIDISFQKGSGTRSSATAGMLWTADVDNGSNVYLGGSNIYKLDSNGVLDESFMATRGLGFKRTGGIDALIKHIVVIDSGVYVAGVFDTYNGSPIKNIAMINFDGTLNNGFGANPGPNGGVQRIAREADGDLILVGEFTQYQGISRGGIVRVNSTGSIDMSFDSSGGFNSQILDVAIQNDGKIVTVGFADNYKGVTRNRVARLNTDGSLDLAFDPGAGPNIAYSAAGVCLQDDGKVIVTGSFTQFSGNNSSGIARLNTDGSYDNTFAIGTGFSKTVPSMIVYKCRNLDNGTFILNGSFDSYNGGSAYSAVVINENGNVLNSMGYTANAYFTELVDLGSEYLAVGNFTEPFLQTNYIKIDSSGNIDYTYGDPDEIVGPYGTVYNISPASNGGYYVNGSYIIYDNELVNYFVKTNSIGQRDLTFNAGGIGPNNYINEVIELDSGKILIFGPTTYNGTQINRAARLNSNGTIDSSFNIGSGFNNSISKAFLLSNGQILTYGNFSSVNGQPRNNVALLNSEGSLNPNRFDLITNPLYQDPYIVNVDVDSEDNVYVLIEYTLDDWDTWVDAVHKYDSGGNLIGEYDLPIGMDGDGYSTNIKVLSDQSFVVIGSFEIGIQGNANYKNNIAKFNEDGSLDDTFSANINITNNLKLAEQYNDRILLTGNFTLVNGTVMNRMVRLMSDGSIDTSFFTGSGFDNSVLDFYLDEDGFIVAVGSFQNYNNQAYRYMVRIDTLPQNIVQNLNLSLNVRSVSGRLLNVEGLRTAVTSATLVNTSNYPITFFTIDLTEDRDWALVEAEMDIVTGRSFVSNLNPVDAPGVGATHSLFVPKLVGQTSVFVCPNASSLEEVFVGCTGGYNITEGSGSLVVENVGGQDYWVISGLTGTGALGLSQYGTPFTITPNSDEVNSTQEVVLSYGTTTGFAALDKVRFTFETTAGFTLVNTCATPTTDADNNSTIDGSGAIVGGNVYEYTFSNTLTGPATVSFCVNVTSPATAGSYSVSLTDDNGSFGSAMYYVGDDNNVFVIANVMPSLSFNIRTLADDADTNVCNFGTVSSSTPIPDYNDQADIASECGYSLAVGTNAVGGFQTQIVADGPLNGAGGSIADLSNGGTFSAGVESYGFASITPSTSGRNPLGGLYTESILRSGNFNLAANTGTSIPTTIQTMLTYDNGVQYTAGVDNVDVTRVVHGIVIGSGTPAGYYDQVITYTTTANF